MPVMNMLPSGSTLQIPLDAPTSFSATAGNAQVELTWTDPLDKYATPEGEVSETGDQLVSEWDHTVLVRKTGSQPAGPDDGTVVVSSSVRNQYQTTPYTDSGLTNDTQYFYGVFAYNKDGVASSGAFVNATPKSYEPILNDNTWEQVQAAAAAGAASSVWAVGDCKEIVLNGRAGTISFSNRSIYAFILGFNHNAALEGDNTIHFSIGKSALTGGSDLAIHQEQMGNTDTNYGGWESSRMRKTVLGISITNYSGRFIGALPADLRAVLKPVQKYTYNTESVTATTDYMFLLGEKEVFGETKWASSLEQSYQEQYAYYASGNSPVRVTSTEGYAPAYWWERSPAKRDSTADGKRENFCYVGDAGGQGTGRAASTREVAPAFVVG